MKLERGVAYPWLVLVAIVVCGWCSLLSGVGGWIMGRDLAYRAARAEFQTAQANLPMLGVQVVRLLNDGPAMRAGIQRGDLIVAIGDAHIRDPRDLSSQLRLYQPGHTVHLTIVRGDAEQDIPVRLDAHPDDSNRPYLGIYYTARADEPADL